MGLSVQIRKAAYGRHTVLENLGFTLTDGTFTALLGRNGSGKSTLLACIAGQAAFEGTIRTHGQDLAMLTARERARTLSLMQQQPRAPHVTVEELVSFGRWPHQLTGQDKLSVQDRERVEYALAETRLTSLRSRYTDTLSGGEQRRAHFAMMLAQDTPIILADESTAFMDAASESRYLEKLAALKEKRTILAVLHDLSAALRFADHILVLDGGKLCFDGSTEDFVDTTIPEDIFEVTRFTARDDAGNTALFFR